MSFLGIRLWHLVTIVLRVEPFLAGEQSLLVGPHYLQRANRSPVVICSPVQGRTNRVIANLNGKFLYDLLITPPRNKFLANLDPSYCVTNNPMSHPAIDPVHDQFRMVEILDQPNRVRERCMIR